VTSQTGVSIDPEFNVKAVRGMLQEMKDHPERLKGKRVLYMHSGEPCLLVTCASEMVGVCVNRRRIWVV